MLHTDAVYHPHLPEFHTCTSSLFYIIELFAVIAKQRLQRQVIITAQAPSRDSIPHDSIQYLYSLTLTVIIVIEFVIIRSGDLTDRMCYP